MSELEVMKLKLKSVTKQKLCKERSVIKLRNLERSLSEELNVIKNEIDLKRSECQELQNKISQIQNQMSVTEICRVSEKCRINHQIEQINRHKESFDNMFDEEHTFELMHNKQLREKEEEVDRERQKYIITRNDQLEQEAIALENETESIEKECSILKKRNNAILLMLRRKLADVEIERRRLMTSARIEK